MSVNSLFKTVDDGAGDALLDGHSSNVWRENGLEEELIYRESNSRLSLTEFENAPHKPSAEINLIEASKWLDPYSPGNRAIFASYLAVGFGLYFIQTPLAFYMVNTLQLSPATQAVITGLLSLPWALKIICGFVSDSMPIMGLRRKPYFFLGWLTFSVCNIILAVAIQPGTLMLASFLFLQTMGFVQADVCTDAMIVERSKLYEHTGNQGTLQATGYIIRFFGGIIGAAAGAVLYNESSWGWGLPMWAIFSINAAVPVIFILPFVYQLVEVKTENPPQLRVQMASIWALVQKKAVWRPCCFIYIYNVLLLQNPAWNSFLVAGLGFSNFDIGLLTLAGAILSYFALVVYKRYLFDVSWRLVYLFSTFISFVFTCLQLVLVFQLNTKIGMDSVGYELLFAMGSYGVVMFVQSIQFLPACRMFLGMCPEGAEGASYAMLTTLSNLAGTVSYSLAAACATIWDVSIPTLEAKDFSGMWRLTLLCGAVQLTGLLFLTLLPSGVAEQVRLSLSLSLPHTHSFTCHDDVDPFSLISPHPPTSQLATQQLALQRNGSSSKLAGSVFMTVVGLSLAYVVVYTFFTIAG
jgi:MFS family permease